MLELSEIIDPVGGDHKFLEQFYGFWSISDEDPSSEPKTSSTDAFGDRSYTKQVIANLEFIANKFGLTAAGNWPVRVLAANDALVHGDILLAELLEGVDQHIEG